MFYSQNIRELRQYYKTAWNKKLKKENLSDLEKNICYVIELHPEYHQMLNMETLETNFTDNNPYLHLGLHLAIQEQIKTNRPNGIKNVYIALLKKYTSHQTEHVLMEILENTLHTAIKNNHEPDEKVYLQACEELLHKLI